MMIRLILGRVPHLLPRLRRAAQGYRALQPSLAWLVEIKNMLFTRPNDGCCDVDHID